jgi:hypothetical protein
MIHVGGSPRDVTSSTDMFILRLLTLRKHLNTHCVPMFFNSDDAEDDSAAEEKTYANYQDYKNSQGKTTKKEEHYLHKHQRQVETDIKRLESKKRTLSLALQNSCNDLR